MSYQTGDLYNFKLVNEEWVCKKCLKVAKTFKVEKTFYLRCETPGDLGRTEPLYKIGSGGTPELEED